MTRVVAVFGGGGAKTLAHAGAWKALLEADLRPSHIVGTSMGAVMGAAFAAGSSYDRLVGIALSLHRNDFAALDAWALPKGVFARSTLKPEPLKRTIARLVPATRFAELQIPFTVTTTDLDSGELVLFGAPVGMSVWGDVGAQHAAPLHRANTATVHLGDTAPLVDVLYASCALPLYFPPQDRKSTRLNSSHDQISYAVFCLKKKKIDVDFVHKVLDEFMHKDGVAFNRLAVALIVVGGLMGSTATRLVVTTRPLCVTVVILSH